MSFERRLELLRRIRALAERRQSAGDADGALQGMDLTLLSFELDRMYVEWGVREIAGLEVDGAAATPQLLAEAGPEPLFREALAAVKGICGLGAGKETQNG